MPVQAFPSSHPECSYLIQEESGSCSKLSYPQRHKMTGAHLELPYFIEGIFAYIAEFSSSICKESGYSAIAGQMELFAKLSIVALSIPELMYLMDVLEKYL